MTAALRERPTPLPDAGDLAITLSHGGHLLATWRNLVIQAYAAEARSDTVERATLLLQRATRARPGAVGSIVLVTHQGRPPDEKCRAAWVKQMRESRTGAILLLFEGTSLRASIVRGVATSLTLLARRSINIHVAGTPREGVPWFVSELSRLGAPCGTETEVTAMIGEVRALAASSAR
jgi:hypothetical protein